MPPKHQQYVQWNGERFRNWAAKIGSNAATVVETILTGYKVEQQGYRACMALLKLSEQYSAQRLENVAPPTRRARNAIGTRIFVAVISRAGSRP